MKVLAYHVLGSLAGLLRGSLAHADHLLRRQADRSLLIDAGGAVIDEVREAPEQLAKEASVVHQSDQVQSLFDSGQEVEVLIRGPPTGPPAPPRSTAGAQQHAQQAENVAPVQGDASISQDTSLEGASILVQKNAIGDKNVDTNQQQALDENAARRRW